MRKSAPIKIIIYYPEDKQTFDKIYIGAVLTAIKQVINSNKIDIIKR